MTSPSGRSASVSCSSAPTWPSSVSRRTRAVKVSLMGSSWHSGRMATLTRPDLGDLPPIVDAAWLQARIASVVVCEVGSTMTGRDSVEAFRAGHLAGARYVSLDEVLAAPPDRNRGPPSAAFPGRLRQGTRRTRRRRRRCGRRLRPRRRWVRRAPGVDASDHRATGGPARRRIRRLAGTGGDRPGTASRKSGERPVTGRPMRSRMPTRSLPTSARVGW